MSWWNPLTWLGFSEKGMKRKLEKLASAIERTPERVGALEGAFAVCQSKITKNSDKIKDRNDINARVQAVQLAITKAKNAQVKKVKVPIKK